MKKQIMFCVAVEVDIPKNTKIDDMDIQVEGVTLYDKEKDRDKILDYTLAYTEVIGEA